MNVFLLFIIGSFFIGLLTWRSRSKWRGWLLLGACLLVVIAYYFFNQI
jgi:hypothetical protein